MPSEVDGRDGSKILKILARLRTFPHWAVLCFLSQLNMWERKFQVAAVSHRTATPSDHGDSKARKTASKGSAVNAFVL